MNGGQFLLNSRKSHPFLLLASNILSLSLQFRISYVLAFIDIYQFFLVHNMPFQTIDSIYK